MGTKTISILDNVYESLRKEKEENESFSDVILRLTKNRTKLRDSFGKWTMSDKEAEKITNELNESWKRFGEKS